MNNKKLKIDTTQTSEKFSPFAEEIVDFLVDSLLKIDFLDKEIFERNKALLNPKQPNMIQPGELELDAKYLERRKIITDSICSKPQKKYGFLPGNPSIYDYLNAVNIKFDFIMKSNSRAIIEIGYVYFTQRKDQFILKKVDDKWRIDSKNLILEGKTKLYKSEI